MKETSRQTGGQVNKLDTQTDKKAKAPTREAGSIFKRPCVEWEINGGQTHVFFTGLFT